MTIYCLEFARGEYSDYTEHLLGMYSSAEKRQEALERYMTSPDPFIRSQLEIHQNGNDYDGEYRTYEIELDKDVWKT